MTNQASFLIRKAALRADPLNTNYIYWPAFTSRYGTKVISGNNKFIVNSAFDQLKALGQEICVQITASTARFPIVDANDWTNRWELWQHYYAQAYYLGSRYDVQRYQMYNEPNVDINTTDYLLRLQLASDAVQSAIADVNHLYGKSLTPLVLAPVTSGSADGSFSGLGSLVVANRHVNQFGVTDTNFWLLQKYDYH